MLRLHDTLSRSDKDIRPIDGKTLRFYACGPTVYGPAHIGNFRTFVAQDVFRRVVECSGTPTLHVRNLTDVDDKTIRDSQKAGKSLTEFTEFWTAKFHADCAALNTLAPHIEPSAVRHIPHQITMIEKLIANGHAYASADGSVYFRVSSFKDYGKLSHLEDRELRLGASEAASATDSDEYTKDSLTDFALWKARKPEDGPNFWPSPWGEGRPGWHLECSAMILEYLGEDFDLHSGGVDLIFPHHENEIAQSCCSTHGKFAAHWFHIAHLMVDGGKMSKSLGNLYTLEDLKGRGYTAAEVRYVLISGHYSAPLNFTFHSLDSARQALQKLSKFELTLRQYLGNPNPPSYDEVVSDLPSTSFAVSWNDVRDWKTSDIQDSWADLRDPFSFLFDNLNVPGALGAIFANAKYIKPSSLGTERTRGFWKALWRLIHSLGLMLPVPESEVVTDVPADIQALAQQRWDAKAAKDWATADALRKQLESAGWLIKDSKEGFTVVAK